MAKHRKPRKKYVRRALMVSGITALALGSTTAVWAAPAYADSVSGSSVVSEAQKYYGVPYVWGGASTSGMDCSGLVLTVFKSFGITLPHSSAAQAGYGEAVSGLENAQPGDLLFFYSPVSHVAIYAGGGMMIDAPNFGQTVKLEKVWATPTAIRRLAVANSAPAVAPAPVVAPPAAVAPAPVVEAAPAPVVEETAPTAPVESATGEYVVKQGDYLSKVFGNDWRNVYEQNKDTVGDNPNLIFPGEVLKTS